MIILWWSVIVLIFLFGFVVLFGAPYVPTLSAQQKVALDLLNLKPGQKFYDLGCGDGRLLMAAAKRGWQAVGIEINPLLVIVAKLYTFKYRKNVKVVWGNLWSVDISDADGIFSFLINRQMVRMDEHLRKSAKKPLKIVCYTFKIPGKKITKDKNPLFLYTYK
jgi:predicted RNA methylase